MDELNKAWFELDLLANKGKDLLENLLHTCKAFDAQKARIYEFVSKRPPTSINRQNYFRGFHTLHSRPKIP